MVIIFPNPIDIEIDILPQEFFYFVSVVQKDEIHLSSHKRLLRIITGSSLYPILFGKIS